MGKISGFFKGLKKQEEDPCKHCYGGSINNVWIPITFDIYNRVRAARYNYKADHRIFSVIINNNIRISIVQNDITKEKVGAIVNGANSGMILGGGLAGAIKKAGTPMI
jgi:hypothetical protein